MTIVHTEVQTVTVKVSNNVFAVMPQIQISYIFTTFSKKAIFQMKWGFFLYYCSNLFNLKILSVPQKYQHFAALSNLIGRQDSNEMFFNVLKIYA